MSSLSSFGDEWQGDAFGWNKALFLEMALTFQSNWGPFNAQILKRLKYSHFLSPHFDVPSKNQSEEGKLVFD